MENYLKRFEMPSPPAELRARIEQAPVARPRWLLPVAAAVLCAASIGVIAIATRQAPPPQAFVAPEDITPRPLVQEPLRVLYVDQLPRWEFRYLKNALIRDPEILAHAWLVSAEPEFPQAHSLLEGRSAKLVERHKSFFEPMTKLPADLSGFDVVILGDIASHDVGEPFLREVDRLVRERGGSLLLIAGTRHSPHGFIGTPIEGLLPVSAKKPEARAVDRELKIRLTGAGRSHPVSKFLERELPPIFWHVPNAELKPGARTLAEIDAANPVFVTLEAGKGRVFASLTDETWRWRFDTGDEPNFYPFWRAVMTWCARRPPPKETAPSATVRGRVRYKGEPPRRNPITVEGDPKCAALHEKPLFSEVLLVKDGAFQNVLVYVSRGLERVRFEPPAAPARIDQRGCQFSPHVIAVMKGQPVEVRNSDDLCHNVRTSAKRNKEHNVTMFQPGKVEIGPYSVTELGIRLSCDVHTWMGAYIHVLPHPKFDISGEDGNFSISGLPAGTYDIEAWHEKLGTKTVTVTVSAGEAATVDIDFEGR